MLGDRRHQPRLAIGVERGGRLVEQPDRRWRSDEPGKRQPPPLPGRKPAARPVGRPLRGRKRSSAASIAGVAVPRSAAQKPQHLARGQRRLDRVEMADIVRRVHDSAPDRARPARRPKQAPAAGASSVANRRNRLDLPLPLLPVSTSAPPAANRQSSPANTSRPPRRQARPSPTSSLREAPNPPAQTPSSQHPQPALRGDRPRGTTIVICRANPHETGKRAAVCPRYKKSGPGGGVPEPRYIRPTGPAGSEVWGTNLQGQTLRSDIRLPIGTAV